MLEEKFPTALFLDNHKNHYTQTFDRSYFTETQRMCLLLNRSNRTARKACGTARIIHKQVVKLSQIISMRIDAIDLSKVGDAGALK